MDPKSGWETRVPATQTCYSACTGRSNTRKPSALRWRGIHHTLGLTARETVGG